MYRREKNNIVRYINNIILNKSSSLRNKEKTECSLLEEEERRALRSPCELGFLSDAGVGTVADKWLVPVMILLLAALNNVAHE